MTLNVLSFLTQALAGASDIVMQLITAIEGEIFILGAVAVVFSIRFLLRPLSGSGSDTAKKRKGDDE